MVHRLVRLRQFGFVGIRPKGVEATVITREITGRNLDSDSMPWTKDIACDTTIDADLIGSVAFHKHRLVEREPVTKALDAVRHEQRFAVRLNIDKLCREIRIVRRRRNVENGSHRPGHLDIAREWTGSIDKNVRSIFNRALVQRARMQDRGLTADGASGRRHRISGIVNERIDRAFS